LLRERLEITVKCYVTEGESRPIPIKNGLSVRFGSDDSGAPSSRAFSFSRMILGRLSVRFFPFRERTPLPGVEFGK